MATFRAVIRKDSAPFSGSPDLSIRRIIKEDGVYKMVVNGQPVQRAEYQGDYVKIIGISTLAVGHIGYIAGNLKKDSYIANLAGKAVKVIAYSQENKMMDVVDSSGNEVYGVPVNFFIPNAIAVKAGYDAVSPKLFEFDITKLEKPVGKMLDKFAKPWKLVAVSKCGGFVAIEFNGRFTVYAFNKQGLELDVARFTGLYDTMQDMSKITGLEF